MSRKNKHRKKQKQKGTKMKWKSNRGKNGKTS